MKSNGMPGVGSVVRPADPERVIATWMTREALSKSFTRIRESSVPGVWEAMVTRENLGYSGLICVLSREPEAFESIEVKAIGKDCVFGIPFRDKYLISDAE
ncbi:MAG: hypothetical protein OEV93_01430 [Candidatus Moranbacteria bacterium]|nr:hypothetical protein [Candidatus Moranbacteria bacterium]